MKTIAVTLLLVLSAGSAKASEVRTQEPISEIQTADITPLSQPSVEGGPRGYFCQDVKVISEDKFICDGDLVEVTDEGITVLVPPYSSDSPEDALTGN